MNDPRKADAMRIAEAELEFQREAFARPFAFKGASFREKWNAVVRLRDDAGRAAIGVGGLAPLWADAAVFLAHGEAGGNVLMLAILERALSAAKGREFADPPALLDALLPEVHDFAKTIAQAPRLAMAFTLNALVALDNAAWILHARTNGFDAFDSMIPEACRPAFAHRHAALAAVPLLTDNLPAAAIRAAFEEGYRLVKVKIGSHGNEREMLDRDLSFLASLAAADREARPRRAGAAAPKPPLFYLDANGRYGQKESLLRLLDGAARLGLGERIAMIEEPFAEAAAIDVSDVPARVAADESVCDLDGLERRFAQGYRAVALKPAGKTLSMTLRIAAAAAARGAALHVADNACVPLLVDWNKNVAARLPPFPGLGMGILESNGPTTYPDWDRLLAEHPCAGAPWLRPRAGLFQLDADFYARSGGVLLDPPCYARLFGQAVGASNGGGGGN